MKRGFSLLELILVVAIIGVLSAIAIPMYLDYAATAKRNVAITNFETASRAAKGAGYALRSGSKTLEDYIKEANKLGGHNPYYPEEPAFRAGAPQKEGEVGIEVIEAAGGGKNTLVVSVKYLKEDPASGDARVFTDSIEVKF